MSFDDDEEEEDEEDEEEEGELSEELVLDAVGSEWERAR